MLPSPPLQMVACSLLLFLLLPPLLFRPAAAAEYTVGDGPWDSGTNYAVWADKHAFAAGDILVFQYVKSQHNVVQVTESTYRSCDTGGGVAGVVKTYTTGFDKIQLTEPNTTYWFICDFPGHCLGGMKLAVKVSGAGAGAGGGGSPPPSGVPLHPTSRGAAARSGWPAVWGSLTLAVLVFVINYCIAF
uniref:Phytocyanin domain-containing protein n=1 Tax=Leersia perrieri TaxID=77586 RepID=A0A0D9WU80_9ORYZ